MYFLPIALHELRLKPRDGLEFMAGVCCFVANNVRRLELDSLLPPTMEAVAAMFRDWTRRFIVVHYDAEACREKGWTIDHDDIVENSQEACELIADLWRYPAFPDLADGLIEELSRLGRDELKSAWFLEYARATLHDYATWPDDLNMIPTKSSPVIPRLVQDRALLQKHYDLINHPTAALAQSPTYWADLRSALNLRAL